MLVPTPLPPFAETARTQIMNKQVKCFLNLCKTSFAKLFSRFQYSGLVLRSCRHFGLIQSPLTATIKVLFYSISRLYIPICRQIFHFISLIAVSVLVKNKVIFVTKVLGRTWYSLHRTSFLSLSNTIKHIEGSFQVSCVYLCLPVHYAAFTFVLLLLQVFHARHWLSVLQNSATVLQKHVHSPSSESFVFAHFDIHCCYTSNPGDGRMVSCSWQHSFLV